MRRRIGCKLLLRILLRENARFHPVICAAGEKQNRLVRARNTDAVIGHGDRAAVCDDLRLPLVLNIIVERDAAHHKAVAVREDLTRSAAAVVLLDAVITDERNIQPAGKGNRAVRRLAVLLRSEARRQHAVGIAHKILARIGDSPVLIAHVRRRIVKDKVTLIIRGIIVPRLNVKIAECPRAAAAVPPVRAAQRWIGETVFRNLDALRADSAEHGRPHIGIAERQRPFFPACHRIIILTGKIPVVYRRCGHRIPKPHRCLFCHTYDHTFLWVMKFCAVSQMGNSYFGDKGQLPSRKEMTAAPLISNFL